MHHSSPPYPHFSLCTWSHLALLPQSVKAVGSLQPFFLVLLKLATVAGVGGRTRRRGSSSICSLAAVTLLQWRRCPPYLRFPM